MSSDEKYEISLFGQKFVLFTTDGNKQELKQVVDYYKRTVEALTEKLPNRPQLDIAILAGLKVTDKLFSLAGSKNIKIDDKNNNKIHEILDNAIKRLDISLSL